LLGAKRMKAGLSTEQFPVSAYVGSWQNLKDLKARYSFDTDVVGIIVGNIECIAEHEKIVLVRPRRCRDERLGRRR